jgi:hypothetical protein
MRRVHTRPRAEAQPGDASFSFARATEGAEPCRSRGSRRWRP